MGKRIEHLWVHIKEGGKSKRQLGPEDRVKLGDWRLGVTSVLGDTAEYASPDILIHLGPVNLEKMKRFESNRSDDLILKELISLMIPFDRNVQVRYHINESETKFRLSGRDHTAYLGINTAL
ncbi:type VI secretion system baseplate subunit TssG [Bacteroides sp. 224]|uniref:type VI secretion system baseplate subunit TssG n=1 Tax=Bacteroides sp. 224 TaxID=2302936 RepID=UPI0013D4187B|nr:type VI secretion system baseplate subunit TssG [Bacteroides sp. 224]